MLRNIWLKLIFVIAIFAFTIFINFPAKNSDTRQITLGLDLQGGTQLEYDIDLSNVMRKDIPSIVDGIRTVIEHRINKLGVSEPNIYTTELEGEHHIIVELPGIHDIEKAIKAVGKTVLLEFKKQKLTLTDDELQAIKDENKKNKKKAQDLLVRARDPKTDFIALAKEYSEDLSTKSEGGETDFISKKKLPKDIGNQLFALKKGQVSKLISTESAYGFYKIIDKRTEEKPEFHARHILIRFGDDKKVAKAKAEKLIAQLQDDHEDFAELAKDESQDPGSKDKGGDLDWFGEGSMVAPFEKALKTLKPGEITTTPVESAFGYHIIKLLDQRTTKEDQIKTARLVIKKKPEKATGWTSTGLTGKQFKRADVSFTQRGIGSPQVSILFDDEGKDLFAKITKENLKKPIAIFLDGELISSPVVQTEITSGQAVITGRFGIKEAQDLAQNLNTGAIPAPIILIGQKNIGATLGAESLAKSLRAGIIGLIILALYLIIYYRLSGFVADIALILYALIVLTIFRLFGVVITLAGVAAFVLSIGMAVDANVLIFERVKEELRDGHSLSLAIDRGFKRAWSSIRDSNLSTLITSAILFMFGSGIIRGFALTLSIGVIVSMFSAIFVTSTLLRILLRTKLAKYPRLFS